LNQNIIPCKTDRIKSWDHIYARDLLRWGINPSVTAKLAMIDIPKESKCLLDVGCGYGRDAINFTEKLNNLIVYGIDSSIKAVTLYNEQLDSRPRVKIRCSDIFKGLPNEFPKKFDVIFSNYFFHLFNNNECVKILNLLCSVMSKKSLFLSSFVSNKDRHFGKGKKLDYSLYEVQKGVPWLFFNEKMILTLFAQSNLEIIRMNHFTELESRRSEPDRVDAFYVIAKIKIDY